MRGGVGEGCFGVKGEKLSVLSKEKLVVVECAWVGRERRGGRNKVFGVEVLLLGFCEK